LSCCIGSLFSFFLFSVLFSRVLFLRLLFEVTVQLPLFYYSNPPPPFSSGLFFPVIPPITFNRFFFFLPAQTHTLVPAYPTVGFFFCHLRWWSTPNGMAVFMVFLSLSPQFYSLPSPRCNKHNLLLYHTLAGPNRRKKQQRLGCSVLNIVLGFGALPPLSCSNPFSLFPRIFRSCSQIYNLRQVFPPNPCWVLFFLTCVRLAAIIGPRSKRSACPR